MNLVLALFLTGLLTVAPTILILVALNQPKPEKVKIRIEDENQYPHR